MSENMNCNNIEHNKVPAAGEAPGTDVKETSQEVKSTPSTDVKETSQEVKSASGAGIKENLGAEIKETTGAETEVYGDYEEAFVPEAVTKKKFKLKKRYIVGGVAALLVLGLLGRNYIAAKNQVTFVQTTPVALGDIENVLSISGTVESAETKTFFSEVTAPIENVNVKVGDRVSNGDVLFTYDEGAIDLAKQTAELAITQAKGSYSSTAAGTVDASYAQGMTLSQINERMDAIDDEIADINYKINEKRNRMNQTLTDIQNTMKDVNQNGIADSYEFDSLGKERFDNSNDSYIYRNESGNKNEDGEYTQPTEEDRQAILALEQTYNEVANAINNDTEIQAWNAQITELNNEKSHLASAKSAKISGGSVSAAKASYESTQLNQEDTISKLDEAKEGIKADFNGVVTAVSAVEGATVAAGTQMLTMANLDDVQVSVSVSKSDLPKIALGQKVDITINGKEYSGEVSKISGNATKNTNGVAVVDTVIKVTNPDDDIILGVEATNKIHAEKAEGTIVLPYEYVLTDAAGDYVYVVENGLVTRRDVTLGITTSTDAQITEGLSEGEEVITSDATMLTEGMPVAINNM